MSENGDHVVEEASFYTDAAKYWENIPATVDGMLGGFGHVSNLDIQGSERFLKTIYKLPSPPGNHHAVDCGAGIGRITNNLLKRYFNKVDLVEQNQAFLDEAKQQLEKSGKVDNFFCTGLQNFMPKPQHYDVIWCQWVLGHLTDEDFVAFFRRCSAGLAPNGMIIVKENLTSDGTVEPDSTDSSVTRPASLLVALLNKAGLKVIREQRQQRFPRELYEVRMYALRPDPQMS